MTAVPIASPADSDQRCRYAESVWRSQLRARLARHQQLRHLPGLRREALCRVQVRLKPLDQAGKQAQNASKAAGCISYEGQTALAYRGPGWQGGPMTFDHVHKDTATQSEVYAGCSDMVLAAFSGFNSCILAYGQTGEILPGHH